MQTWTTNSTYCIRDGCFFPSGLPGSSSMLGSHGQRGWTLRSSQDKTCLQLQLPVLYKTQKQTQGQTGEGKALSMLESSETCF